MNKLEDRISAFVAAQTLPYRLSRDGRSDCNCVTKAKLFSQKLSSMGIQSRSRLVGFQWSVLGVPEQILAIPHDEPGTHKFLEVFIPERDKWVTADPTWDPRLCELFEIPKWDGLSATSCAVPIARTLSDVEVEELLTRVKSEQFRTQWFERNNEFVVAVDGWLEKNRVG